ncbi:hypothetical protein [Hyalangium rubrum]|uniref:Uncharacterized protein n=1 Tax=Hyalangium rubrum TaxID=3103134 RepID=A0ABU5HK66_9BACT|nr:hypothetical protein [Hyalangium sp. s54d21]MDY7233217.1 hypothetical protein [Hyalangium sp. s54d21]
MSLPLLTLPLLLVHAASVSPATVPARGAQEAILSLDRAGRYIVKAQSPAGTACDLVDHVRGPFAHSGAVGRSSCELDLLLDAGTYKLRLSSKSKGTGKVALSVTPYEELNATPLRLEPRREVKQRLLSRQQASYWLKIDKRQPVTLRIAGRHVGDVRLWRTGEWLEPISARDTQPRPRPGMPIHEWWFEPVLEPGVYLLTAYGSGSTEWTQTDADDSGLTVAWEFPMASEDRIASVTLPETGLATLEFPEEAAAFFLSREGGSKTSTRLSLHRMSAEGATNLFSSAEATCEIDGKALVPECRAVPSGKSRRVALIRGEPGARVTLRWARLMTDGWTDGVYGTGAAMVFQAARDGDHLVAIHETPIDQDSAPVGCAMSQFVPMSDTVLIGRDLLQVGDKPFRRAFNYDGRSTILQFEVTRSGRYTFQTSGDRKNRCELFRVDTSKSVRLTETLSTAETCRVTVPVSPGLYELRIYAGTEGIETVTLAQENQKVSAETPTKVSCLFPRMRLQKDTRYALSSTRVTDRSLRGLFVRPLPLTLSEPLPLLLEGGATLKLPLEAGRPVEVRSLGGEPLRCTLGGTKVDAKDGVCALPGSAGELTVENPGVSALSLSIRRPAPPPAAPPPLVAWNPNLAPLPVLAPAQPAWFDFERTQSHALTFDVKDAGLYHVTTQGLLSTECKIRTPVVQQVGAASGGGRGRNCLVSSYLRPGRYLLDVRTVGQSRGRGAVVLERRSVKSAEGVSGEAEVFFRADAGELIQQKLQVPKRAEYTLSTAAQSGALQCRLDDPQGWPVVSVPAPCTSTMVLSKGRYLWTQLPLTVESMRRTSLERVRPTITLKGNKAHPLRFNAWYRAELGKDGKDEFSFEVPARTAVSFALTNGMQGRLYTVGTDNQLKPVETLEAMTPELTTPQGRAVPRRRAYVPPPEPSNEEGEGEYEEGSEESPPESSYEEGSEEEATATSAPLPETDASAPLGRALTLEPGRYRLVAEHSRGDVSITYAVYLRVDTLVPGVSRTLNAPDRVPLRLPAEGTLRLSTQGDTDVRCRIFDAEGNLVVENADRGADWNCAIAEPFAAGDYTLVLESQTQQPGPTRVSVAVAKVTDAGTLADKATLKLDAGVQRATLPPLEGNAVQEVVLRGKTPIACALEDDKGAVVTRQLDTRECVLLVRPGGATWRVRVWTLSSGAQVTASLGTRPVAPLSGGSIPAGAAVLAKLAQPGRYQTGAGVYCLPATGRGPLKSCAGEASLEAGEWIFSGVGAQETSLKLAEVVDAIDSPKTERLRLTRDISLLRQSTRESSLHLFQASVQVGDRSNPACSLVGGTARQDDFMCVAATGPTQQSLARWWTPAFSPSDASVSRLSVPVPSVSTPLQPGLQNLAWSQGPTVQLRMPASASRVQLSLPKNAWAVLVDEQGTAVDLCAPASALTACVLTGKGGSIFLHSPEEARAQAEVIAIDLAQRRINLGQLYEAVTPAPARQPIAFGAQPTPRQLAVSGALRCVTTLDDGSRLEGCDAKVPAGRSGELMLDLDAGGVRAVLAPAPELRSAALGSLLTQAGTELPAAKAVKLAGPHVERSFTLASEALVHVRSSSGVCGIVRDGAVLRVRGDDKGCAIDEVLPPGGYRLVVRGFADRPLSGTVHWTQEPVKELKEGVASEESWIAPTQTRFFRFATQSPGRIGLGLQVPAELLECTVLDAAQRALGQGCQQFLQLDKGSYLLAIHAPANARPLKFKPVLVGLAGAKADVPEEYLRDFFQRIGVNP